MDYIDPASGEIVDLEAVRVQMVKGV